MTNNQPQFQLPPSPPSDWEIGDLYKRAWKIVKTNKVLWWFGIAMASGGYNWNSGSTRHSSTVTPSPTPDMQNLLKDLHQIPPSPNDHVLGTSTNTFFDLLSHLFSAVPLSFYFVLILEVLLLLGVSIIIAIIYKSWAYAALLEAIESCIHGGVANMKEASEKAFTKVRSIIWLSIVPPLIVALSSLAAFSLLIGGLVVGNTFFKLLFGLLLAGGIFFLLYVVIMLTMTQIWAPRQVIVDGKTATDAFWDSYKIAKKKFWASLLLGIVNVIVGGLITFVILLPILGVVVGGVIVDLFTKGPLLFFVVGIGAIIFVMTIIVITIFSGIINAFKATVWSLAYNNVRGKYDK